MAEQPMPIPNGRPSIQGLVRHDLDQREQIGVQRYGTPLQAHNGRDAFQCVLQVVVARRPPQGLARLQATQPGGNELCVVG